MILMNVGSMMIYVNILTTELRRPPHVKTDKEEVWVYTTSSHTTTSTDSLSTDVFSRSPHSPSRSGLVVHWSVAWGWVLIGEFWSMHG